MNTNHLRHPHPAAAFRRLLWCLTLFVVSPARPVAAIEGAELLGTKAPEWRLTHWLNSEPLTLKSLAGKVVLVRWWTAPQCPYCAATAPALNEFHATFREAGLQVVGLYHHKAPGPLPVRHVEMSAAQFGFRFPVATDPEWQTLREWWLRTDRRRWTSVTFLLDRRGTIRHIHPGGEYVKGDPAYLELRAQIEKLLAEK